MPELALSPSHESMNSATALEPGGVGKFSPIGWENLYLSAIISINMIFMQIGKGRERG
jgi:hypothetical protein